MPAMPTTTVQKMIGAIIILISLMKPSPNGFIAVPSCGYKMSEQHADDDGGDDLEIQRLVERLAACSSGHGGLLERELTAEVASASGQFFRKPDASQWAAGGSTQVVDLIGIFFNPGKIPATRP